MTEEVCSVDIPQKFWLSEPPKQLSHEELIDKLYKDPKFKECYDHIIQCYILWSYPNTMVIFGIATKPPGLVGTPNNGDRDVEDYGYGKDIWKIYDDINYLESEYSKLVKSCVVYPPIYYMRDFYDFADKLCGKYDPKYSLKMCMSEDEVINGYALYNVKEKSIMNRYVYEELITLWKTNKIYAKDEFTDVYDNLACSDWAKQDEHGNSFGGYWNYPNGSFEKLNAWNLTRNANGVALWKLPYPKEVVLKTIALGCNNRMECVRYSNFLCEWLKRKLEQMTTYNSK